MFFVPGGASTPERIAATRAGIGEWVDGSGGVLSYKVVDHAAGADVTIRFLPGSFLVPNPMEVGRTATVSEGHVLRHADISLTTAQMTDADLTEHAAHEWRYTLGIHGHSDNPGDLMYGVTVHVIYVGRDAPPEQTRRVTTRDRNTIERAYPAWFREIRVVRA